MSRFERPNIRRMRGYTWGEQPDDPAVIKLNTNENPHPPSPAVQQALAAAVAATLRTYPQPTADHLRDLLGREHGVSRDQIIVTNGGDEALRLAITTFVEPGACIGYTDPGYSLYPVLADIHDARIAAVALNDDWSLPEDFAAQVNAEGAQLSCIVNPHAPSGSLVAIEKIAALSDELDGILLLDEAYVDFVDPALSHDATHLLSSCTNLLILRSFSKGYSLAGLRLGYLLGPVELIDPLVNKTRDSYNINGLTQLLGEAAFADQAWAARSWESVREERAVLTSALADLGIRCPPSQGNFLLAQIPASAPLDAQEIYRRLKQTNILVRHFAAPRLEDKLRITIGTADQNQQLISALVKMLQ